jgi:hypothetical protein
LLVFSGPLAVLMGGLLYFRGRREHHDIRARVGSETRFRLGFYGPGTIEERWHALEGSAGQPDLRPAERRLLLIDLAFPPIYGGVLAIGLIVAWWKGGKQLGLCLVLAPVIVAVVADWIENLVLLATSGRTSRWTYLACMATVSKNAAVTVSLGLLAWLVAKVYA